ncbi:intraflagellar transport protein 27 homolog isoform X2 [Lycorma delicatula]
MFITDGREFPKNYNMTLGVDVNLKQVQVSGDDTVELLIYDSTGLDLYRDYITKYWDAPSLLMVVYDVTLQSSFESVPHWLQIALGSKWDSPNNRPYAQVLVANKIDLINRRFISEDIGKKLAEKYSFQYFETSSKENQGIEDTFLWLAKKWHGYIKKNSTDNYSQSDSFNSMKFNRKSFTSSMTVY